MGYDKLKAENEKATAALKSIIEERDKERAAENRREKEYSIIDKDIRDFCKTILSKRDANSGKDPADILKDSLVYDSMPTKKLVAEAKKAREEYDEGRIDLMRQLHNENSSLKKEKHNLEEHYRINKEALTGSAEEKRNLKKSIARLQNKVSSLQDDIKKVKVSHIDLTDSDKKRKAVLAKEAELIETKTRMDKIKLSEREKEIAELTIQMLNNPSEGTKEERARFIFGVIGNTGLSVGVDIENEVRERLKDKVKDVEESFSTAKLAPAFTFLCEKGILKKDKFRDTQGQKNYYVMTGLGNKIYYDIEGKEAKESNFARMIATHSSEEHGYGILTLAKEMRKYPKRFSNISEFNKGNDGVSLKTHILVETDDGDYQSVERRIEPDIAFDEDYEQRFIEYEIVTQSKKEYFEKFDKYISYGSKMLIFIFPSTQKRKEFLRYVEQYKEEKESEGILYDVEFYLYTFAEFKEMCEQDEDWKPYKLGKAEDEEDVIETKEEEKKTEETEKANTEKASSIRKNLIGKVGTRKRAITNIPTNIDKK